MPAFLKSDEYAPEPVELSPSRQALAERIAERDAAKAAVNAETDASATLGTVHDDVAPARAALDAFDRQHAIGMSNWSRGLVNGRPVADAERRAKLAADLADAELASAAATAGQAECQANAERLAHALGKIEADVFELARAVAIEDAMSLLPQIAAAIAHAESLRHRLDAARALAVEGLGSYGQSSKVSPALESFDTARRDAESRPFEPAINPFNDGWRKYAAALALDASVDFASSQEMDVQPAPFRTSAAPAVFANMPQLYKW
jgi:hypothetical protein